MCVTLTHPRLVIVLISVVFLISSSKEKCLSFLYWCFMVWYCTQELVVRWGSCLSTTFATSNGVRQGGILSLLFFSVYVGDLSNSLNNAKVGCSMTEVTITHMMHSEDLVLMAPSILAMQITVTPLHVTMMWYTVPYQKKCVHVVLDQHVLNLVLSHVWGYLDLY